MGVEVRAFGPMEIVHGGAGVRISSRLQQVLLAMLLLRRGGVVSVPTLAEALWPVKQPATVVRSLQIHVHRLRRLLGDAGAVQHRPPGYACGLPPASVDLYQFEELAQRGRAALVRGEESAAAELLRQAAALPRGPAFQGLDDVDELALESRRLDELRLAVIEDRVTAELALASHAGLVAELGTLVQEHPLRERFRAQLMTALYRTGRRADALAAYRAGRRILIDELGVEPNEECRALERAILADDPALLRPRTSPQQGAGERAAPVVPRQLPADVPGFTGRDRQLRQLDAALPRDGADRSTTCVISAMEGMAGVGKTALAVNWAHRVADRFPDGQLYVNLRGYDTRAPLTPIQALTGFLRALGVPADQVPADVDEVAAMYRSLLADRRVLVLLDNAASADQVRPLVPGGSGCLVLVTSRDQLAGLSARDGARRLALDVLPASEAHALLVRQLGAERVAAEPAAVTELIERCGFLPLALRIAAANLTTGLRQPIADYLAGLRSGGRLAGLAVAGDDQLAVAAAFGLSYRRLPEASRRAFRRLALVPGPDVTAEAVAALVAGTQADGRQELTMLAGAHLVEEYRPGRFACHDLLRAYARDRVQADETRADRQAALRRLHAYYLAGADAAADLLHPHELRLPRSGKQQEVAPVVFPGPGAAVRWLDAELPNLAGAVRQAAAGDTGDRSPAWLLTDTLRCYLRLRGRPAEAEEFATTWLAAAEAAGERRAYGCALLGRAGLHHHQARPQQALADLSGALAAFRETGWVEGQGVVLGNLGATYLHLGRLPEALAHHREALALTEKVGSRPAQADAIGNLAVSLLLLGRLREAAEHAHRSLDILTDLGSHRREGENLGNLGDIYRLQGEFAAARRCYVQAQSHHRQVGDRDGEGAVLLGLALLHCDLGRLEPAREFALAALTVAQETRNRRYHAGALTGLARIHHRRGEAGPASQHAEQARDLAGEVGDRHLLAEALVCLADFGPDAAGYQLARASADQALDLTRRVGFRLVEGQALTASAAIRLAAGELDCAVGEGEHALAIHQETGHRPGQAVVYELLARARSRTGDEAAAQEHARRARVLAAELGIATGAVR